MQTHSNAPRLVVDDQLAKIAIQSVRKAMETLFTLTPTNTPWSLQKNFQSHGDISGIISMVQEKMEATLIVSFEAKTIFQLMKKVYKRDFTTIDSSIQQGVGELTNIIYSSIKQKLNDRGHEFKMAIPNVVIGQGHSIINLHEGQQLVVPFSADGNPFYVEVATNQS